MKIAELKNLLSGRVLIGDGAMGTMLYEQGIFINTCFEELNIQNPKLIKNIHSEYVNAGADFIKTNTFGANRVKLAKFGLENKVADINKAAVDIARSCAIEGVMVAGSIGPSGIKVNDTDNINDQYLIEIFTQQINELGQAGVDFLVLETFRDTQEIILAIKAAKDSGLPIVAHISITEEDTPQYEVILASAMKEISGFDAVCAVGLNCSIGPAEMFKRLDIIKSSTSKPISLQPNSGMPRKIDDRSIYMCTPEYFTEYAKRFYEKGVKIISGCCGTTPEHISQVVKSIKGLEKARSTKLSSTVLIESAGEGNIGRLSCCPLENKSLLGSKLAKGEKIITIEISPPRGNDLTKIIASAKICKENGIDFINIPDGPRASSRLSAMITAIKIQQEAGIETIPHYCCRDKNLISIQSELLGYNCIGINNILAITGDPPKLGDFPFATAVYDLDSISLSRLISSLNAGKDILGKKLSSHTALTIGVGVNPEAVDIENELTRLAHKIENGAEYVITQPVFSAESFERFFEKANINVPILAGIWPLTSFKNAEFMATEVPGVSVPQGLLERMAKAGSKIDALKTGVDIAREMIAKIESGIAGLAISAPFGNVKTALAVIGKYDLSSLEEK